MTPINGHLYGKSRLGVYIYRTNLSLHIFRKHCFDKMAKGNGKGNDSVDKIGKTDKNKFQTNISLQPVRKARASVLI